MPPELSPLNLTPRNGRWVDAVLLGMVLISVVGLVYRFLHN